MTKDEFLGQLMPLLASLPWEEQRRVSDYYSELILDGIECGRDEEALIAGFGNVEDIARRTLEEYAAVPDIPAYVPPPPPPKKRGGVRALLVLAWIFGFFPGLILVLAAFILYLAGWIVVLSLVISGAALVLTGCVDGALMTLSVTQYPLASVFRLGTGLLSAGLGVLLLLGSVLLVRLYARVTRILFSRISRVFSRKEVSYASDH